MAALRSLKLMTCSSSEEIDGAVCEYNGSPSQDGIPSRSKYVSDSGEWLLMWVLWFSQRRS